MTCSASRLYPIHIFSYYANIAEGPAQEKSWKNLWEKKMRFYGKGGQIARGRGMWTRRDHSVKGNYFAKVYSRPIDLSSCHSN